MGVGDVQHFIHHALPDSLPTAQGTFPLSRPFPCDKSQRLGGGGGRGRTLIKPDLHCRHPQLGPWNILPLDSSKSHPCVEAGARRRNGQGGFREGVCTERGKALECVPVVPEANNKNWEEGATFTVGTERAKIQQTRRPTCTRTPFPSQRLFQGYPKFPTFRELSPPYFLCQQTFLQKAGKIKMGVVGLHVCICVYVQRDCVSYLSYMKFGTSMPSLLPSSQLLRLFHMLYFKLHEGLVS